MLIQHRHADEMLSLAMPRLAVDADRRFLHALVYGVLRHYFSLEADVFRFVSRKPEDAVRMALLLGALQIRHLHTPAHAAVGETVEAVRQFQPKACGLVNAVLRKLAGQKPPRRLKPHQRLELPQWLYRRWRDSWGAEQLQQWMAHADVPPPLSIAVRGDRDAWVARALAAGLQARPSVHVSQGVLLPAGTDVQSLPGFAAGNCWVMDQSAQASVQLLAEGLATMPQRLLDVCAAPGGKTAMLAALMAGVEPVAIEFHAARLQRWRENMERLSWTGARAVRADAARLPLANQSVDALFLDAPCTASGVLRKHPDIRFLHDESQLVRLAQLQVQLLAESARVLRSGGCMVYAVCSIHAEEQQPQPPEGLSVEAELRLFPETERDGFYAMRLRKA